METNDMGIQTDYICHSEKASDEEIRMACVSLMVQHQNGTGCSTEYIVDNANRLYEFVKFGKTPELCTKQ